MHDFSLQEAQLFRLLVSFFGIDRVVPKMSVLTVCGGELPERYQGALRDWARSSTCLFTVVDGQDSPKLVVEFYEGFADSVDVKEAEHSQHLPSLFSALGIHYITISAQEFVDLITPGGISFFHFLQAKVGMDDVGFS